MFSAFEWSESPVMDTLAPTFAAGLTFDQMVAAATTNVELFTVTRGRAVAPPEYAERIAAPGRRWHLLTISEDWCGDGVNILPWVDALAASSPHLEHRIIRRDEHLELMDRHLTNGRSRSIPIVLLLDEDGVELDWWGPRPRELQAWFESPEAQAMPKDERYKVLRTRYARDRGRAIMEELTAMIERAAGQPSATRATESATVQA